MKVRGEDRRGLPRMQLSPSLVVILPLANVRSSKECSTFFERVENERMLDIVQLSTSQCCFVASCGFLDGPAHSSFSRGTLRTAKVSAPSFS